MKRTSLTVNVYEEVAEAYIRAWLKADSDFTLPPDDPDASIAAAGNLSAVWKVGSKYYVVQTPPWC